MLLVIFIFFALLFAAFLIWGAMQNRNTEETLSESGFTPTVNIAGLRIDEKHGLWNKQGMTTVLNLSEITDCEVIEDGVSYKSDNGVMRAVVGGALFGGVGAIVGAVTSSSSERVSHLSVCIYTNNPIFPKVNINLISQPTAKSSTIYRTNKSTAESIVSYINKVSGLSERKQISVIPDTTATVTNADELAKYKKLLDEGAITEEEYSKIKEKILSEYI